MLPIGRLDTGAVERFEEALPSLLRERAPPGLRAAVIGCAGPLSAAGIRLTNAAREIDPARIGLALDLERVTVVNDFVPLAAAATALNPSDDGALRPVGPSIRRADGPRLVCGPGTGFGAALVRRSSSGWLIEETEAGHVDFGPAAEDELALWPLLERVQGRITVETVLSGNGLVRMDAALRKLRGLPIGSASPESVLRDAAAGEDLAGEAVELFLRLFGRAAGDLALVFKASGGVLLAGGIVARMLDRFDFGSFRKAFEAKSPFEDFMRSIPTDAVIAPEPALSGAALIALRPESFMFEARTWDRASEI